MICEIEIAEPDGTFVRTVCELRRKDAPSPGETLFYGPATGPTRRLRVHAVRPRLATGHYRPRGVLVECAPLG